MSNRVVLIASVLFLGLSCLAQSTSSLPQQLGSPVFIDEATITRDSVLQQSRISNESDRAIKAITLGCLAESPDDHVQVTIGSPVIFENPLAPSASKQLTTQYFPNCIAKPLGRVIFFVARAKYADNSEYIADVAAIKAELSRKVTSARQ